MSNILVRSNAIYADGVLVGSLIIGPGVSIAVAQTGINQSVRFMREDSDKAVLALVESLGIMCTGRIEYQHA